MRDVYKESQRSTFDAKVFGKDEVGNEVCKTRTERDNIFYVVHTWKDYQARDESGDLDDDELIEFRKFKRANHSGHKWIHQYSTKYIILPTGSTEPVLRRMEKKRGEDQSSTNEGRIVLCQEEVFDALYECHRSTGHLGQERTYTLANMKYFNITQKMVRVFCQTCSVCMEKNPIIKASKGARKPILSHAWRDRFQVDLIDMRKFAQPNIYGVIQRWLMTVKDHSTGFTAVFSLPRKKAKYVAFELEKYFGIVGYPTIFHTDNGNEFTARVVIDILQDMNPSILTVTGRPRTPRDQGSVERANQTIKRIVADVRSERRKEGRDDNWTLLLGLITSQLNTHSSRQVNSVPAYNAVFGADYHIMTSCSIENARSCKTIDDIKAIIDDNGHLEEFMKEYYEGDDASISTTAQDEYTLKKRGMEYWDGDISDDNDDIPSLDSKMSLEDIPKIEDWSPLMPEVTVNVTDEVAGALRDIVNSVVAGARSHELIPPETPPDSQKCPTYRKVATVVNAWSDKSFITKFYKGGRKYTCLLLSLNCEECRFHQRDVIDYDSDYCHWHMNLNYWFDTRFINQFVAMLYHCRHLMGIKKDKVRKEHCQWTEVWYPEAEWMRGMTNTTQRTVELNGNCIVMLLFIENHYAVMEIDVKHKMMMVYDGLGYDGSLAKWTRHHLLVKDVLY